MQPYGRPLIALGVALRIDVAVAGDADDPVWRTSRDVYASSARMQLVASFDHQVTGVTVAPDRRMFVSFPRWTEGAPLLVAEWV